MKIKQLARREIADLNMLCDSMQQEVESAVSKIKEEEFRFYTLPKNEKYRLLKLNVWTEHYQVSLDYILSMLLPFWQQWIPKRNKRAFQGKGLGVRIATLTGKKSEQLLKSFIERDFPSGQNKILYRSYKRNSMLDKVVDTPEDGIKTKSDKTKTLFDFPNPKGYVQYYQRHIRNQMFRRERLIQEFKTRNFRGNPFL